MGKSRPNSSIKHKTSAPVTGQNGGADLGALPVYWSKPSLFGTMMEINLLPSTMTPIPASRSKRPLRRIFSTRPIGLTVKLPFQKAWKWYTRAVSISISVWLAAPMKMSWSSWLFWTASSTNQARCWGKMQKSELCWWTFFSAVEEIMDAGVIRDSNSHKVVHLVALRSRSSIRCCSQPKKRSSSHSSEDHHSCLFTPSKNPRRAPGWLLIQSPKWCLQDHLGSQGLRLHLACRCPTLTPTCARLPFLLSPLCQHWRKALSTSDTGSVWRKRPPLLWWDYAPTIS